MYLLRLDDASEHWNKNNWLRMHELLSEYGVKPLVALIPRNEDQKLLQYPIDESYWDTIHAWINEGWTPALHGCNHVLDSESGGLNPVNLRSEFAGKPLEIQREKLRVGLEILRDQGIDPGVFVAPAHTFDENTLEALSFESGIRIISDTIASDVYYLNGFYYIPQQSGQVRALRFKTVTFCYHPNTMAESNYRRLEEFLSMHGSEFGTFDAITPEQRQLSQFDRWIRRIYFLKRKLQ